MFTLSSSLNFDPGLMDSHVFLENTANPYMSVHSSQGSVIEEGSKLD